MISRRLDKLGRVVLPQEMRSKLQLSQNALIDIELKGDKIILSKSSQCCLICGSNKGVLADVKVCKSCAQQISEALAKA